MKKGLWSRPIYCKQINQLKVNTKGKAQIKASDKIPHSLGMLLELK
jgi:hypothetical protein